MKRVSLPWGVLLLVASLCQFTSSQSQPSALTQSPTARTSFTDTVPRLIRFSGTMRDASGLPMSGAVSVTFALYDAPTGGTLLWSERQTVQCNNRGHYTVLLGSTQEEGLPMEVFASRQARWLGNTVEGEVTEHERMQLTSTPYALKAADADSLGGRPASAYLLSNPSAPPDSGRALAATGGTTSTGTLSGSGIKPLLSGTGTTNFIPLWTSSTNLGSSIIKQTTSGNIGIGVTSANAKLVVKGNSSTNTNVRMGDTGDCGGGGEAGIAFGNGAITCSNLALKGDSGGGTVLNGASFLSLAIGNAAFVEIGDNGFGVTETEVLKPAMFDSAVTVGPVDTLDGFLDVGLNAFGYLDAIQGTAEVDNTVGVFGENDSFANGKSGGVGGVGVMGQNLNAQQPVGVGAVAGTSNVTINAVGVMSQASGGFATGIWGSVDAPLDSGVGIIAESTGLTPFDTALVASGGDSQVANVFDALGAFGSCSIDWNGDLFCDGSKSAVVPVDQGQRKVALYAMESPENWFEDFGSASLVNGVATVRLDATFSQTVNTSMDYHVFLTPGGDCKGLYVTQKTANSFEVHELGGGTSNVEFDYRIVARRKGYEAVRMADKSQTWQDLSRMRQRIAQNKPSLAKYTTLAAKSNNRKPLGHVSRHQR